MKHKAFLLLIFLYGYAFSDCNSIDQSVKKLMQKNKVNGVAIAIVNHDNTEFCNYGFTSSDKKNKVDQHTLFDIASISKTMTATLAGIATAQGIFDLQTPIDEYVTALSINPVYKNINSQELLAHVSGLKFTQENNFNQSSKVDFISKLSVTKARYLPQTHYQYGQVGITLVAMALEEIYKKPFSDILQQQLLNKIKMNETFINVPANYTNLAIEYDKDNKPLTPFNIGILTPAGGLKSSTQDLAKYLELQLNGSSDPILRKALDLVHKNYYCLYPDGTYQQLAWVYHPGNDLNATFKPSPRPHYATKNQKLAHGCAYDPNGFIEKSGNSYGMSLYLLYMPSTKTGVVVLTNKAQVANTVNLGRNILKQTSLSPQPILKK